MCCSLGHTCTCTEVKPVQIRCHTCSQLIDSDDYAHIDKHINEATEAICEECHISIPKTYDGLCRSCEIDKKIADGVIPR